MSIRKAVYNDAGRLAEIHIFGWRSAYRNIVSDKYLFGKLSVSKRIDGFKKSIEENNEETYVYEEDEIIKGFMTIGICRNEDKKDAFELWGLYVDPLLKRNGVGRKLIQYCEDEALKRGFKDIVLWVFEKNTEGRAFYKKLGYEVDGKREFLEYFQEYEIRYIKRVG